MRINHQGSAYIDRMYLAAGQYERDRLPNGQWRNLTYMTTPTGLNAVYTQNETTHQEAFYFIHTDYQGSIMAIADYNGQLVEEYSYDPWGNRRDPNTWQKNYTNTTNPGGTSILYRGYTFHEQLDCFALINMNGRMYDPVLGRMLSADNYTHSGTQGLNRYSYVFNNPLKYTDPDGEFPWLAVMIGVAINATIQARSGNMNNMLAFGTAVGVGAAAGAAGYYMAGLGGTAFPNAPATFISSGYSAGLGGFGSGFVGGFGNSLSNGQGFGSSLIQGIKTGGAGIFYGVIIGGTIGGIRSVIKGGNFFTGKGMTQDLISNNTNSPGTAIDYTKENAEEIINLNYKKPDGLNELIVDENRLPPGGYSRNNGLVYNKDGLSVSAVTYYRGISYGNSDVYLFNESFRSAEYLEYVIGHEFVHVDLYSWGITSEKVQEAVAYNWARNRWGFRHLNDFSTYPWQGQFELYSKFYNPAYDMLISNFIY